MGVEYARRRWHAKANMVVVGLVRIWSVSSVFGRCGMWSREIGTYKSRWYFLEDENENLYKSDGAVQIHVFFLRPVDGLLLIRTL